jgi:hypothetical protein
MAKLDSSGEVATRLAQFTARQPPGTLPFQPPEGMILRAGGLTIKLGEEVIGASALAGRPRRRWTRSVPAPGWTRSGTGPDERAKWLTPSSARDYRQHYGR